ncbi:diacylglycerol kinase family protein [uncultured Cellulomonas sp.]|uniref:diacylglycerol/lipid kinase family protein n=1 Tax=uncultured Cellulomonas sp. TaxID=189682 RepID=UPI00261AAAB3|nr:diacylglycerol kinase family protein [uncultured Cellulomonas sp.]
MPTQPDLLAVVNAAAGSAGGPQVDDAVAALRAAAGHAGARVELVATTDLDHLADTLAGLAGRRLVVLGGDGSVRAAVQTLHDAGTLGSAGPVGIVPLGTGNDLARSLGIPDDPARAADAALTGTPHGMAVLVGDDGAVAVNAVHVGVGAAAARNAAGLKPVLHRVGLGVLAYPAGAVLAGLTERGWRLRVTVDGEPLHAGGTRLLMVAIGLGETVGGGAPLVPGADPRDAVADVVVSEAVGPLARLGYAKQLTTGSHVRRADVRTACGRVVRIEAAPGEPFPADVDGEVSGPVAAQQWRLHPAAWSALVPAAS